jgi:cytochrome c
MISRVSIFAILPAVPRRLAIFGIIIAAGQLVAPNYSFAFTREQVDRGRQMYRLECARCHGPDGQGATDIYKGLTAPPLIGPDAFPVNPRPYQKIRHFQFHTVLNIYEFASSIMPLDQPGSLTPQNYWDVIAYLLAAGGMKTNDKQLNEDDAAQIHLSGVREMEASKPRIPPMAGGHAPLIEGETRTQGVP